jgi:hypothetical protein
MTVQSSKKIMTVCNENYGLEMIVVNKRAAFRQAFRREGSKDRELGKLSLDRWLDYVEKELRA